MQRFQIEDLVVQDESGVVFRAFDTETSQTVALRRFFPRGPAGGGLSADEQIAYNIALERLAGTHHPSLRSVVCGGCDPVDGMPFIATEWIEGTSLPLILENAPLAATEAADLLGKALEVCQLLSEVLAEEAVWVETVLQTIVRGTQGSSRGVTFWISPFKWLGDGSQERGLESIIGLTEELMGWQGQVVGDQDGRGLGGWLRWLRGAAETTSLREARETLAASVGVEPPESAKRPVRPAGFAPPARQAGSSPQPPRQAGSAPPRQTGSTQPAPPQEPATKKKPGSRMPLVLIIASLLIAVGVGGWALSRRDAAVQPSQTTNAFEIMDFADLKLDGIPTAASKQPAPPVASTSSPEGDPEIAEIAEPRADVSTGGDVFSAADYDLLMAKKGEDVILEGVLEKLDFSGKRTIMYLIFSESSANTAPRGGVRVKGAPENLSEAALKPLINQKIRLQGRVEVSPLPKPGRPIIFIKNRAAIQEVE